MAIAGLVGYFLHKFGYEMAPLLLALVLGDRLEENFRLALTMSGRQLFDVRRRGLDAYGLRRPVAGRTGHRLGIRLPQGFRR